MSGTLGMIFGIIVICVSAYLLVKQYETRMVLLGSGFLMAIVALKPLIAFAKLSEQMVNAGFIQSICSSLGFAMVLQLTMCDKHLIHALAKGLRLVRPIIIPGVAVATFLINNAITSAAGCSAAVGVVMIPLLISQGVAPAMAATAVMLGTFGSVLSPGNPHNPMVAELSGLELVKVIQNESVATIACLVIGCIVLVIVAKYLKEDKGYHSQEWSDAMESDFKINPLLAILPLLPIIILVVCSQPSVQESVSWAKQIKVPHAMLFGAFLCMVFSRTNPQQATKKFFEGMGKGYADIIGIIVAAGVFVSGMGALGMIDAFINALKDSANVAKVAAGYGPFLLAILSGSGDAATLAFNGSVTPQAVSLGIAPQNMGSLASLAGSLGRTMSPIAGATIICAGLAKVSPFEIAKRNAPGMLIASVAAMVILMYF